MFNFVTTALSLANTWAVLKPAVMPLVTQVLYPMLCHDAQDQELWSEDPQDQELWSEDPQDQELWSDDPQEFIRRSYDVMEDYSSPRVSALSLVSQLCRKRPKACLEACLEFCNQRFAAYEAGTTDAAGKDGAMYLLGSLGVHFADCKASEGNVSSLVAEMLVQRVAKDLRSEQPHLRGRACWAVGQFSDFIAQ
ncbi:armadillo-type protein, partial [Baffinella frigidus]